MNTNDPIADVPNVVSQPRTLRRPRVKWNGIDFGTNSDLAEQVRVNALDDKVKLQAAEMNLKTAELSATAAEKDARIKTDAMQQRMNSVEDERAAAETERAQAVKAAKDSEQLVETLVQNIDALTADLAAAREEADKVASESMDLQGQLLHRIDHLDKVVESERALIEAQADVLQYYTRHLYDVSHLPPVPGLVFDGGSLKSPAGHAVEIGGNKTFKVLDPEGTEVFKTKDLEELINFLDTDITS